MEDRYPSQLEAMFPRVLNKIVALWDEPEIDDYFEELLVDRRGGRKGFPPEVVQEIFFLSNVHDRATGRRREEETGIWELEHARGALSKERRQESPQKRFFKAVAAGDINAIKFINVLEVDVRGEGGWTALMVALQNRHEGLALLLLDRDASAKTVDAGGQTPLHWAAFNGCTRVIPPLLQRGAALEAKNAAGATPLSIAAERGHAEAVKLLISKGANTNTPGAEGLTPLHRAIVQGHLNVVSALLASGAEVNTVAPGSKRTPLHEAVECGNAKLVEILLKRGANANARAADGATPLSIAKAKDRHAIGDLLTLVGRAR
jgi:tankyrase